MMFGDRDKIDPYSILGRGVMQEKGEQARYSMIIGAIAISDVVKTTMGPKGMDKILKPQDSSYRSEEVEVTNDGATILKSMIVASPSAKVLVDISKTQDNEVGDGTTSVCVLAGELLRQALDLMEKGIHAQSIIEGWRAARQVAYEALEKSAKNNSASKEKFQEDLLNIAKTTLSSKVLSNETEKFSKLAVDAVMRLKLDESIKNLDMIHIIKKLGGSIADSFLAEGFILDKEIGVGQPKRCEKAKILLANTAMDNDKIKIHSAKVRSTDPEVIAKIEKAERERMLNKCKKILSHGINCFINRQLIYNLPEEFFADHGVVAIEHADFEGVERLGLVLGAEIVSTFDNPKRVKLGSCNLIHEIMIGEDKLIHFSGVERGEACTVVLRGSSKHILDEAERSLHDALCVLSQTVQEKRTVLGAGCSEMIMANAVDELAKLTPGKKAMAVESFARALRMIPTIIAENAGFDASEITAQLRAAHYEGNCTAGIDIREGAIGDVAAMKITESFKVKSQILLSASEAAEQILRVDQVITHPPRPRERDPRMH